MRVIIMFLLTSVISLNIGFGQNRLITSPDFPSLEDRYLGQKPPGLTPELFAPGIISTNEYVEGYIEFTPDMKEVYFTRHGGKYTERMLFFMRYENNSWTGPSELSTDIDKYKERFTPGLSALDKAPFKGLPIRGLSVSSKGTFYIYFLERDGSGHISYSRLIDGKYETPQKMNKEINKGKWIAHPFVAPDESYLMWDAEKDGEQTPDIYISFLQPDGSWGKAISLGDKINTPAYEQGAKVSPDGKYLFFWRGDEKTKEDGSTYWVGDLYWVDAQIIQELKSKQQQ